jgi:uncharacterized protein YqgV (UPF0045/DUF77 family)
MARVRVEFTVEPFVDGQPGEHVLAAWRAVEARGAELSSGPFSSEAVIDGGDVDLVVGDLIRAALASGADRVSVQVERLES